jgi:hypothetical protein
MMVRAIVGKEMAGRPPFPSASILTLCHKSIHRWNQLCKGFILSHFEWVACIMTSGSTSMYNYDRN